MTLRKTARTAVLSIEIVGVCSLLACGSSAPQDTTPLPSASRQAEVAAGPPPLTLSVPGRSSANVSIAADGDLVAVAWGAATESGSTDVYAAVSRDGGGRFADPVLVSGPQAAAQISGEQPPRVTLVPHPTGEHSIVIVWTSKGASGTRLVTARSDDGGKSFGRSTTVQGSEAPGNRGWESIATRADGRVMAAWLDHRETAAPATASAPMHHEGMEHTGHAAASDGAARAQLSKLYVGPIDGSEGPRIVTGGVCYCCKTALTATADGALYAAWRHVYAGNLRDIAFSMSRDGGATFSAPLRVSEDQWALDGCPENGPAIAVDAERRVHLVWPTLVPGAAAGSEPTLGLFYAVSSDGTSFSARQRLTTEGTPYHATIAVNRAGALVAAWDELADGRRRPVYARGSGGASPNFVRETIARAPQGSYPVVASTGEGFVLAWTDTTTSPSHIALQRLP
jgi:hypothetical protein